MLLAKVKQLGSNFPERIIEERESPSVIPEDSEYDYYGDWNESPLAGRRWGKGIVDCEPLIPEPKLPIYSARLGQPTRLRRVGSTESLDTDISLLSCSSIGATQSLSPVRVRQKSKTPEQVKVALEAAKLRPQSTESGSTTNWEQLAKRKEGMLEKMMMKDRDAANALGAIKAMNRLFQAKTALEAMTEHECRQLLRCAVTKGLNLKNSIKSLSMTDISKVPEFDAKLPRAKSAERISMTTKKPRLASNRSLFAEYDRVHEHIGKGSKVNLPFLSPVTSATASMYSSAAGYHRHMNKNLRNRITSTMNALGRMTGLGDQPDRPITNYEERNGQRLVHIDRDFEKHARLPHHVHVAPQLSQAIRTEIRDRIGKPKPKVIKRDDLTAWSLNNRKDPISHRNLMVYTWLQNLDEKHFVQDVHGFEKQDMLI